MAMLLTAVLWLMDHARAIVATFVVTLALMFAIGSAMI